MRIIAGILGFAAVTLFIVAFMLFAWLTPEFNLATDYISQLGAQGEPMALYWNLIGFGGVGVTLAAFGWAFGATLNDRTFGLCLVLAGLGFALAGIPTDFADAEAGLSRLHFASICLGLAGWCFALARLSHVKISDKFIRTAGTGAALLGVVPLLGLGAGASPAPVAHRVLLAIVFGWVLLNSIHLWTADNTQNAS